MRKNVLRILSALWVWLFCAATLGAKVTYYVTPSGSNPIDENLNRWEGKTDAEIFTLQEALDKAVAGDEIWLLGFEQITNLSQLYTTPSVDGWTIPSGVKVFGGFAGTETNINQRETLGKAYQMKYRSVLSGDIDGDDKIDPNNTIFPQMALYEGNETRDDNATHVLTMNAFRNGTNNSNDNSNPTVVDGLTISGGHADGQDENGGGIYVKGDANNSVPYSIDRCYFLNNYGNKGGAIYVEANVKETATKSLINQCVVYNNVAGTVVGKENVGGGIYIDGAGNIVNSSIFNNENGGVVLSFDAYLVNSTVARNTGGGVDMTDTLATSVVNVYNSVVWGNSNVFALYRPNFSYSAYPEADEEDGYKNLNVSTDNQGDANSPRFDAPSLKTSFDTEYDWRRTAYPLWSWGVLEGSYLINKGNNDSYNTYANGYNGVVGTDLGGMTRMMGDAIDLGSYEFQTIPAARIRYVKTGGNDNADGLSWGTAYKSVQKAINELEKQPGVPGEVWIAAGTYEPTELIEGNNTPASFRMCDGISLYGGFAGTETVKSERVRGTSGMPWDFANKTVLRGNTYEGNNTWNSTDNKWSLASGSSHVVWFAPREGEEDFKNITVIEGVTVEGGQAKTIDANNYDGARGAGVYIKGGNTYLVNSIVKDNVAPAEGGGIYLNGGRVQGCLVYNNSSETKGGGIYVDNAGLVLRSMITNNSALEGGAVYLDNNGVQADGELHPEYQILSTSIVSNNTSVNNGAVYCNKGGVILQSTIVNNSTPTATDNASDNASQTAGLYIDSYAMVVNSVLWENRINGINTQLYAKNASAENVQFHYTAVANMNGIVWNNTLQEELIELSETNVAGEGTMAPGFSAGYPESQGVQGDSTEIKYFWQPITGANLRARGMSLGMLPADVLLAPELDITGNRFAQKPAVGAYRVEQTQITPEVTSSYIRIYVDVECSDPKHGGDSWATAYRSLNEAIDYMSKLTDEDYITYNDEQYKVEGRELQIYVMEGDAWPRYASVNLDPKSATIDVPAMAGGKDKKLTIKGGYSRENHDTWAPLTYRTQINGNHEGKVQAEGLYHCITVEEGAEVEFDGFHIINGYAAGTANLKYGAGMLVRDGANVTVKNSIFENNTAVEGAAIDARGATLTLENCVVNNNTNTDGTKQVINALTLTMHHVTVVNNVGAAPASMGTSSFSAGNTSGNTFNYASVGVEGYKNFANPTNNQGATLGFDTYLGGYSNFAPLTSSADAGNLINKASGTPSGLDTDIAGNGRSLGGAPDLGAYEANLPVAGTVVYVKQGATGNGTSWEDATGNLQAAVNGAGTKEVWVAAGEYTSNPSSTTSSMGQKYAFSMKEGVNVYGGFPNSGTPGWDDRNPQLNETILQPTSVSPSTNVTNRAASVGRVLVQPNSFSVETVWDGFTLQNGYLFSCYRENVQGSINSITTANLAASGGAGAYLQTNGVLENCVIKNNIVFAYPEHDNMTSTGGNSGGYHQAGGGVCIDGGVLRNCIIEGNKLQHGLTATGWLNTVQSGWMYGAGLFMNNGSVYNTIIKENVGEIVDGNKNKTDEGYSEVVVGAGAFLVNGSFYNNTITGNIAQTYNTSTAGIIGTKRANISIGGIYVFESITMYNCIVTANVDNIGSGGNYHYSGYPIMAFNADYEADATKVNVRYSCINIAEDDLKNLSKSGDTDKTNIYENPLLGSDYQLQDGSPCINTGTEVIPNVVIPDVDAAFTARIKDCTIDMGAYESANETNLAYETTTITINDKEKTLITYYVNQAGAGLRDGSSVTDAACAMKLQQILTHAGQTAKNNPDADVVVKLAGYEGEYGEIFVYNANTLSNSNDPQSYTFVVPYGVTIMGGFKEGGDWTDTENNRNPKQYRTVLSAIAHEVGQDVNGYHTVTFGGKPSGWTGGDKTTIIDGLYLIDGKATSMAGEGNPNTRGGGAIVPAWAHIRNCVVAQCEAVQGGGLYLMPGATVSGTLVMANTAEDGAGIYADNEGIDEEEDDDPLRSHVISCTVTDNTATGAGGGIYLEDGAMLATNTVIWGNKAPANKSVSGAVSYTFADTRFANAVGTDGVKEFYPFNHCYVETYEMPSNYENTAMVSDESLYFTADRTLKAYSELVKHGTTNYAGLLAEFGIAEKDMQGIARKQGVSERIDVGAYAFEGGIIPLPKSREEVVTRIFVNQGSTNVTDEEGMDGLIGRTFYTPVSWLDDALDYIDTVRTVEGLEGIEFEIYVAGGTYKPSNRRTDAASTGVDQRQNSYVIPEGVKIYGGFSGEETYSCGRDITISGVSESFIDVITEGNAGLLASREYSDLNNNGILEPWEFANQTIFSGDINVSPIVKNAYHVVFSLADKNSQVKNKDILLDGITIKDGETSNELSSPEDKDEIGRGGAIYTNGVNYTLNGCRVMNSRAVRGGAIYSRDANMTIIGSVIGGNGTIGTSLEGYDLRGGAIYMSAHEKEFSLKAINTLWANNETAGKGGAIATSNDLGYAGKVTVSLMNNTIVRNKAAEASAVYSTSDGTITNTVMWGGEGNGVVSSGLTINNSASDAELTGNNNVKLSATNMAVDGPRFAAPSQAAGLASNSVASKWNPASISLLTDAGDGVKSVEGEISGAYDSWWTDDLSVYKDKYMTNSDETEYMRYAGPLDENGKKTNKTIDIGLYEYQYKTTFRNMDDIYVDTQERGDGSGDSWGNATSDLRGAIIALSDPDRGTKTDKTVHIRGGEYMQSQLYVNDIAYQAKLNGDNVDLTSLTIKGSYAENGQQDFSQPTAFLPSTAKPVATMFYAQTNGKTLNIEGVTFQGATVAGLDANNSGTLNLKNVAFRNNGTGAVVDNTGNGKALFANTLFADGTTGLTTKGDNVTVVNATFANNTTAVSGSATIYNTVAWNSGEDVSTDAENGNVNLGNVANDNILEGPNFVDPDNENVLARNYMIRPSIKLIDAAVESHYNTVLGDNASTTDKDLGNNARMTGDGMDIGAYEYNAPLQQIVYVKSNVAMTDGSGTSWENPIEDLQGAIDLASIYANKNSGSNGYVFVHSDVKDAQNVRLNMPNVKVYGGMNDEVAADITGLINARSEILSDNMTTINGLNLSGASSVMDGFKVTGTANNVTDGMLSTSVIENATVDGNGIVYNAYVPGTLTGTGKAVNVTSPNAVTVSATAKINVVESAQENGYVSDDIWKYQLKEDNNAIDAGADIASYITLAGHSKDLSGSPRVRNKVDNGCFETWNITSATTLTAAERPTEKHVVYVRKGVEMDIVKDLYPDGTNFNVGFLLLEHGAGLRSNGNAIKLTNFAVERNLNESNNRWDMCYMPFEIVKTEGAEGVSVNTYDGATRAAYDYKFSSTDGAWTETGIQGGIGMLMQVTADAKVRMYGNNYTEAAGATGQVQLMKYNNMQPWNSSNSETSQKFTHLENMSWNMFGSPFLCAMNYDDMEYGRVIYKKSGDTYASENTADEAVTGSIEAGSAVLTQTATLQTSEIFQVNQRTSALSDVGARTRLAVALAPQGQDGQDELSLAAVPTDEASDQFNMAADGVKMMTVGKAAQIYLERGGKQYSMLTALDLEGKIDVGVLVLETGLYTVYIPEDCPMEEYETVVLEDKVTGRVVDLLEGAYDFQMNEADSLSSRFTLSFNRELAEQGLTRIRIQAMGNGQVRITGLTDGDQITAYQENGVQTYSQRVASVEKNIALPGKVCLIKVTAADGQEIVKKLVIR